MTSFSVLCALSPKSQTPNLKIKTMKSTVAGDICRVQQLPVLGLQLWDSQSSNLVHKHYLYRGTCKGLKAFNNIYNDDITVIIYISLFSI